MNHAGKNTGGGSMGKNFGFIPRSKTYDLNLFSHSDLLTLRTN